MPIRPTFADRWLPRGVATWVAVLAALPILLGLTVTMDDGFYYLNIARHVAQGHGATFDGVHPTNGYHPLWMLMLVPVFWLTSSPAPALLAAKLLQGTLAVVTAWLLFRLARRHLDAPAASLVVLAWAAAVHPLFLSGMEHGLHTLLTVALALVLERVWGRARDPGVRACGAVGLVAALLVLARIDAALLVALVLTPPALRLSGAVRSPEAPGPGRWRALAALVGPPALVTLGYVASNLVAFGHASPVSSAVKRDWSRVLLSGDPLFRAEGWWAAKSAHLLRPLTGSLDRWESWPLRVGLLCIGLWLAVVVLSRWVPAIARRTGPIASWSPWALYGVLQVGIHGLWFHAGLSYAPWYFAVQPWLGPLLLVRLVAGPPVEPRSGARAVLRPALCLAIGSALVAVAAWTFAVEAREQRTFGPPPQRVVADWIDRTLPPDLVIGSWNAGMLGYWSGRRVVNLDGLVNSWRYFSEHRHELEHYLRSEGVDVLVDAFTGTTALSHVNVPLDFVTCQDVPIEVAVPRYDWSMRCCALLPVR